jgi:L-ascorbate metabolism protein UlaG (beta-lactamase superfamily)
MKKQFITMVVVAFGLVSVLAILMLFSGRKPGVTMENVQQKQSMEGPVLFSPISHASIAISLGGQMIYVDPVGGAKAFEGQLPPAIILVTDSHQDHFDVDTLRAVSKPITTLVVPQAVKDKLPSDIPGVVVVMKNGEQTLQQGVGIEAIPMYNLPESADSPHVKGRGNGYVLTDNAKPRRVYIAGDTAATPEMKALKDIDVAFVPMNPPYTMSVEEAAEGVLAFKPKFVYPYHYRGPDGLNDVNKFKELVESKDPNIKVELLDFYPQQ